VGTQPNVQRIPAGGRVIEVQMGSIHAVKGETHFATLVLETHNHKHSLKSLIPWLLEDASGPRDARAKPVGPQQSKRLRLYYVAFLCGADLTWRGEVRVDACGPGREASPLRRPAVVGSVPSATVRDPAQALPDFLDREGGQIPGINLPGRVKKGPENLISVVSAVAVAAGPTPSCQFVPYPA